ncbi:MAG TPA: redoxin domain-containing protein [Thermomicrobiaceae bacterium]|nr:redoxin domain-containing protein [Thermomicrobiaceae bacterium]
MAIDTTKQSELAAPPARGEQIPAFSGNTADGRTLGTRDFSMRRNLALIFTHGPECSTCRALLRELGRLEEAVRAEAGETLAVVPAEGEELRRLAAELPFPVIGDPDLAIHRRYGLVDERGAPRAAIFVTDRYGVVFEPSLADDEHRMLEAAEVPGWLEFIACRCT